MPTTELTKEERLEHAMLCRSYEASCATKRTDDKGYDNQYRSSTGNALLAVIPEMSHSHVLRCYEANCALPFPEPFDFQIRLELQKSLGRHFGLRSFRASATAAANRQPKRD